LTAALLALLHLLRFVSVSVLVCVCMARGGSGKGL
jgi:hypothetical protein